jgi:hypothetical protein
MPSAAVFFLEKPKANRKFRAALGSLGQKTMPKWPPGSSFQEQNLEPPGEFLDRRRLGRSFVMPV